MADRPSQLDAESRKIDEEIKAGLPCEQKALSSYMRSLDYYYLRGIRWLQRREAESDSDFNNRPKLTLPFTRRVVDLLCSKLYNPGPNRSYQEEDDKGPITTWMNGIYTDNLINSLWQRADRMSTLHGVALFQVAATGDAAKPLKIKLWDHSQFVLFADPDDNDVFLHVVTIDRLDEQTRYTWWTKDRIRVYLTDKVKLDLPMGGRTSKFVSEEPNPYGRLPFVSVHYDLPVNGYETPGLGEFLSQFNGTLDSQASDMAGAVQAYHTPLGVAYDVAPETNVVKIMGKFARLLTAPSDFEGVKPRLEYLQAELDVTGGWENIRSAIRTTLDGLGLPEAIYAMVADTMASGAAMIAEQIPLVEASKSRQEPFRLYERNLAELCLWIGGVWYEDTTLWDAAQDLKIACTWPPEVVNIPGPERDQQDQTSLDMGLESRVDIKMRRSGLSRDQAIAELERVDAENQDYPTPAMTAQQQQQEAALKAAASGNGAFA